MPSHLVNRIDLDLIYPPFLEMVLALLADLEQHAILYVALSGYRSKSEQARLYFQGRTTPGNIVTNARPGYTWHNYGLAIDVARDLDILKAGLQPTWDPSKYTPLKEAGEKLGLQVGVSGKSLGGDPGHVQYIRDGVYPGLLTKLNAAPDLQSAWAIVDALG